jgi:hypothetical protein
MLVAEAVQVLEPSEASEAVVESNVLATFTGASTNSNIALGVSLTAAGAAAFMMGMTDVFFAEATAWTFVIWGVLFILVGLADIAQTYVVREDGLEIKNAVRLWDRDKYWLWDNVYQLDVAVTRPDGRLEDTVLKVHHQAPGATALEREDRAYDPELAGLIIEHANLSPSGAVIVEDLTELPRGKAVYTWK